MVKRITSDEYEKLLGSDEDVKVLNITSRLTDDMIYYESKIIHTDREETEILSKLGLHSGQKIVLFASALHQCFERVFHAAYKRHLGTMK